METFLFLWFGSSVAVAIWADSRGWSGLGYFFMALFLSPFLAAGVTWTNGVNHRAVEKRALRSGYFQKCFMCAELVKKDAVRCPHCAADLSSADPR